MNLVTAAGRAWSLAAVVAVAACAGWSQPGDEANSELVAGSVKIPLSADYDRPPRFLSGRSPIYPISQVLDRKSGHSNIEFTIGEDGRTRDFKIIEADYEYYANHAIIAVQGWRFEPAVKDGKPVAVRVQQGFRYTFD